MIKVFEQFNENDPYGEENWDIPITLDNYLEIIRNNIDGDATIKETRIGLHFVEFDIMNNLPNNIKKKLTFHLHHIGGGIFGLLLINDNSEINLDPIGPDDIFSDLDEKIDKLIHCFFYEPSDPFKVKKIFEQFNENDPYNEEEWGDNEEFEKDDLLIAKKSQFKRRKSGIVERIVQGEIYRVRNVIYAGGSGTKYHTIIVPGILTPVAVFGIEQMKEFFEKK